MATYSDIKLKNYDLLIQNGDFVIAESSQQEVDLIINTFLGNWFQFPSCGVGIINYLAGNTPALVLENVIVQQMIQDKFIIEKVSVKGSTLNNIVINVLAHRN